MSFDLLPHFIECFDKIISNFGVVYNNNNMYLVMPSSSPSYNLYRPIYFFLIFRILCGLTQFTSRAHIIRAALEAICFQTRDILEAMNKDCGFPLTRLQVDGGMTTNNLLMQLQADLVGIEVG